MRHLTVLYDADCGFCERCRRWLENQPKLIPLEFVAGGSPEAVRRFPDLVVPGRAEELIVVSDEGDVYRNDNAWLRSSATITLLSISVIAAGVPDAFSAKVLAVSSASSSFGCSRSIATLPVFRDAIASVTGVMSLTQTACR